MQWQPADLGRGHPAHLGGLVTAGAGGQLVRCGGDDGPVRPAAMVVGVYPVDGEDIEGHVNLLGHLAQRRLLGRLP
jgi:hypothetical protein